MATKNWTIEKMREVHNVSLTRENFWDDLKKKYPGGVQMFCDWIDNYKEAVNWDRLFRDSNARDEQGNLKGGTKKFHELPIALQMGIWFAFLRDRGGCQYEIEDMFSYDLAEDIANFIPYLQSEWELENEPEKLQD